jgi:ABC-type multidrug transport system ATPase subunit
MTIEVEHIRKQFGQFTALDDVSLKFADGELTALLGPSGCGTTAPMRRPVTCASARSASCSSITRCSST